MTRLMTGQIVAESFTNFPYDVRNVIALEAQKIVLRTLGSQVGHSGWGLHEMTHIFYAIQ